MTTTRHAHESAGADLLGGMGASPPRHSDPQLVTGRAQFIDDIEPAGTLHVAMVRSSYAHADIISIDASAALRLEGVHAVLTGPELRRLATAQPVGWQQIANQRPGPTWAMAVDRVRYSGQIVAAVAAESRALAEDAAELVEVEYEPLPAVMTIEQALAVDAPRIVADWPDNVFASETYSTGDCDGAFERAPVRVSERLSVGRSFGCPLETRGCVATWEPGGRLELWINSQSPNRVREVLAEVLDLPVSDVRVRVPAIGGGFGSKANYYGEEIICCLLARQTMRPVKYIEDRAESFFATSHARQQEIEIEAAADELGTILALRAHVVGVLGGEISSVGMGPVWLSAVSVPGPYRIANLSLSVTGVMTNRTPYGSFRGWGAPKAAFAMERIIERLARQIGVEPNDVRRRNLVRPEEMPYANGIFATLDSGRYEHCLDVCIERLKSDGWYEFRDRARAAGRKVGIGFGCFVESTGIGPSRVMAALGIKQGGFDEAVVRMDSTGAVTVFTGQTEMGQGMTTALAQICADELGVPVARVTVVSGDTDSCPYTGYGTGGSRVAAVSGVAVRTATIELRHQILRVAANMLEAAPEDLEIDVDAVRVRGVPDRGVALATVAHAAYRSLDQAGPDAVPTLQGRAVFDPIALTYANGVAAAVVEVDPITGGVQVCGYTMVDDCGTVINPQIVDGQLHGGIAQAIGGALFEHLVYSNEGQLLTTTFMDYLLPTAAEMPPFATEHVHTPAPNTPGGMKGVGEAGTVPGYAAIAGAVDDAIGSPERRVTEMPITPQHVVEMCKNPAL
ncbi:MAG: xanthine dehydrogenase family protein molybdopterin-binding subunit [Ilumatobacteraceae bacterium]